MLKLTRAGLRACLLLLCCSGWVARAGSDLYFPRFDGSQVNGLSIFNSPADGAGGEGTAQVTLRLFGQDGSLISGPGITNPSLLDVPAGQNTAFTAREIFGSVPDSTRGWIEATSEAENLTGFFQVLAADLSLLDGADIPPVSHKIHFNDVRVSQGFSSELNIFVAGTADTTLTVTLLTPERVVTRVIGVPSKGVLRIDDPIDFFQDSQIQSIPRGSYVQVLSQESVIGGFQLLRTSQGDLLGLNARPALERLKTLFFPQLAVLGPWEMEVNVVNYAVHPVSLLFHAFGPDGTPYGQGVVEQNPATRALDPGFALVEDVVQLFGFSGEGPFEGSLKVEAFRGGAVPSGATASVQAVAAINGSVRYSVTSSGSEAAVVALADPGRRALFGHIATVDGFFTGIAGYNPASSATDVRVMAFTEAGVELGLYDTILMPGERIARLLTDIIPGATNQNGGYVWVESTHPIHLSSLFGSFDSTLLANVPPQPSLPGFLPDSGKDSLQVVPNPAPVHLGQSRQFDAVGVSGEIVWSVDRVVGGEVSVGTVDGSGTYQSPETFPSGRGPLTLQANVEGTSLSAASTIDLIERDIFSLPQTTPDVVALAYLEGRDRLYGAQSPIAGAAPQGQTGSAILVLEPNGPQPLLELPARQVSAMVPFRAWDGSEFLLLATDPDGAIHRLDPETAEMVQVASGFSDTVDLAWHPVTGNLLVADSAGIVSVSRVRLESDLVSGVAGNGRDPVRLLDVPGLSGMAVDGCTGQIFAGSQEGGIDVFDLIQESAQRVHSGLSAPSALLPLFRKDGGCRRGVRLLVAQESADKISLLDGRGDFRIDWAQPSSPRALVYVGDGLGTADSVFAAGDGVERIEAPGQYQPGPGNSVATARAGGVTDRVGDTFGLNPLQQDATELSAFRDDTALHISLSFVDPISPCSAQCLAGDGDGASTQGVAANALAGAIDLDLDQDAGTGAIAFADLNSSSGSGLGVEACVFFSDYDAEAGGLPVFRFIDGFFQPVGRVAADFGTHSVRFSIPLSLLDDDGLANLAGVFGTGGAQQEPTDVLPETGSVTTIRMAENAPAVAVPAVSPIRARRAIAGDSSGWKGLSRLNPR